MQYDIIELADRYAKSHNLAPLHRITFVSRARLLQAARPKNAPTAVRINQLLADYASTHAPSTVKGLRGDLLTLWRYIASLGMCEPPQPGEVWRPKVPATLPECYTIEEVRAIVAGAAGLRGMYGKVRRADYWSALVRAAWDTGLRKGDLMHVSAKDLRDGHVLVNVAHKTGVRMIHTLAPATVAALIVVGRLGFPAPDWSFTRHWHKLIDASVQRGQFKWIRRSSGSYVALEHGDAAGAAHLGHTSVATFKRYYDARLVGDTRPMPPRL